MNHVDKDTDFDLNLRLKRMSSERLLQRLGALITKDQQTTAALIAHLAEVETRSIFAQRGWPSMYAYCTEELGFSEGEAYNRIAAARVATEYPVVFGMIDQGKIHLTGIKALRVHLTLENHQELLVAASGLTKRGVEKMLAERFPKPDVPPSVRKLPGSSSKKSSQPQGPFAQPRQTESVEPQGAKERTAEPAPSRQFVAEIPARRDTVAPLSPTRFKIQFTANQEFHDKLRCAQELLSHQIPNGDLAAVLGRALDLLVAQAKKDRFAVGRKAGRKDQGSTSSRSIPAAVRRAAYERDEGQCTFVSTSGRRCAERSFLELDHIRPYGQGGPSTVENIRLHCKCHNAYAAEQAYGVATIARAKRKSQSRDRPNDIPQAVAVIPPISSVKTQTSFNF